MLDNALVIFAKFSLNIRIEKEFFVKELEESLAHRRRVRCEMLEVCLGVLEAGAESIVVAMSRRGTVLLCLDVDVEGKILIDK
jgi:hypothetical protein